MRYSYHDGVWTVVVHARLLQLTLTSSDLKELAPRAERLYYQLKRIEK